MMDYGDYGMNLKWLTCHGGADSQKFQTRWGTWKISVTIEGKSTLIVWPEKLRIPSTLSLSLRSSSQLPFCA